MKLWEAIIKGSEGKVQLFNGMVRDEANGVCAMGAAECAYGSRDWRFAWHLPGVACPVCESQHLGIYGTIICLNTEHKWTFKQISDFVRTIEEPGAKLVTREVEEATRLESSLV